MNWMFLNRLVEITDLTVNSFVDEDLNTAATVEPLRELIGILCNDLKMRHIKRLRNGQCDLNTDSHLMTC